MLKTALIILFVLMKINLFSLDTVKIAVDEGVIPLMYEKEGEARGLYPLLIKEIFDRIEVDVVIEPLPWKRALFYADEGLMGVGGVYKTKDRLEKYDFSDELFKEIIVIYTLRNNSFEYNKLSDLYGKKVGILRGWSYGDEFDVFSSRNLIIVEEVSTDEQNFKKLLSGRVDCILIVKEVAELILEKNPSFKKLISLKTPTFIVNPTYLIFSKGSNQRELLDVFNKKLMVLKEDEEYISLIKKGMRD